MTTRPGDTTMPSFEPRPADDFDYREIPFSEEERIARSTSTTPIGGGAVPGAEPEGEPASASVGGS